MNDHHDHHDHHSSSLPRTLGGLGLLGALLLPASGAASVPLGPEVIAADADPHCEQASVELEIDVATGDVYLYDPESGSYALTDGDIDVYLGELSEVEIILQYTTGEWEVEVTPGTSASLTYRTTRGELSYVADDEHDIVVFSTVDQVSASTMMTMTPIVPDVIIRPTKECPPPP